MHTEPSRRAAACELIPAAHSRQRSFPGRREPFQPRWKSRPLLSEDKEVFDAFQLRGARLQSRGRRISMRPRMIASRDHADRQPFLQIAQSKRKEVSDSEFVSPEWSPAASDAAAVGRQIGVGRPIG